MKALLKLLTCSLGIVASLSWAQFPIPTKDLGIWKFEERTVQSIGANSASGNGAKISHQSIAMPGSSGSFLLIEECYDNTLDAKMRVKTIPKLSQAAQNGGIFEKGFNIEECVYIVNVADKSQVTAMRYTVYPLFYAHMVGRHDFLYYVSAESGANLRKAADKASDTKFVMPFNGVVYVISDKGDWKAAVTVKGSGFMHSDLLTKIYPK